MSKRRGRPPLLPEDRRVKRVSVRFTRVEWKHLKERAAWLDKGVCDYLREKGLAS